MGRPGATLRGAEGARVIVGYMACKANLDVMGAMRAGAPRKT
jgi:hypothetical protein